MSDRTHFEVLHGRVSQHQQLCSSFHRPSISQHSRTCDSQRNLHTYLLCVGAKNKMLANSEISCYHPAHILKQHGPGQCLDSVPSQDLAVAKYRGEKTKPLLQHRCWCHSTTWSSGFHGFPLCKPATFKWRKKSFNCWQQSQSWLIWQASWTGHISTNLLLLWFLLKKIFKSVYISGGLFKWPSGNQVK